jgi:hypothetical protein
MTKDDQKLKTGLVLHPAELTVSHCNGGFLYPSRRGYADALNDDDKLANVDKLQEIDNETSSEDKSEKGDASDESDEDDELILGEEAKTANDQKYRHKN